jgi:hypothetical protein
VPGGALTADDPRSARQNIPDDSGGSTSAGLRDGIQSPVIIWS